MLSEMPLQKSSLCTSFNRFLSNCLISVSDNVPGGPGGPCVPFCPGGPCVPFCPGGPCVPFCPGGPCVPGLPGSPGRQGLDVMAAGHDPAASVLRNKTENQLRARRRPTRLRDISDSHTAEGAISDRRRSFSSAEGQHEHLIYNHPNTKFLLAMLPP